MFKRLTALIRRVMYQMGIIKGLKKLSDHKNIPINEEMYKKIAVWQHLYKGFYDEIHTVTYHTIEGRKTRKLESLKMGKVAAQEMASLIFNEKCKISIDEEELKDFIDEIFKRNRFYKNFQDYLEYMFALGGMVIKPYVKGNQIFLSYVTADCFIPVAWQNDVITEGVFVNQLTKGNSRYTHLEWHVWEQGVYVVRNELYEAKNGDELGIKIPLATLYPDLEEEVRIENLSRPLFVYFKPNMANNIDTQSPLGISIFANATDTMKAIDIAFDSLIREFRLGRKRIIVPSHMLKAVVDPETGQMFRYFDASDETYEAFNSTGDSDTIKDINVELRVEEHINAINALLNIFAMQTGFSTGTFTFDGKSMKTATEVISEQSKTFKNKKSHEIIIEEGLHELVEIIIDIARLYDLYNGPTTYELTVAFDDSIVENKAAEIDKQIKLVNAELTSRKRAIMEIHGVTEEEALQILEEIRAENSRMSPELEELQSQISFFGQRE